MMLSTHFSLEELVASEVATRADLDNTPPNEVMPNLSRLAEGAGARARRVGESSRPRDQRLPLAPIEPNDRRREKLHAHARSRGRHPVSGLRPAPPGLPRHRKLRHPDRSSHS